jgi:peptidoglycan-associated lipoprotein
MRADASGLPLTIAGLGLATILLTGCPKTPVLAPEAGTGGTSATAGQRSTGSGYGSTSALQDIHFDLDRAIIRPEDERTLDANAQWLKANPEALLLIEGHTDERGDPAHNMVLGERRARATRDALVARQVDPARISIKAYGEQRPVCTQQTNSCWAKNRRAHFLVKL